MNRDDFLKLLAAQIKAEVASAPKEIVDGWNEPYRQAADQLVDDALALID